MQSMSYFIVLLVFSAVPSIHLFVLSVNSIILSIGFSFAASREPKNY